MLKDAIAAKNVGKAEKIAKAEKMEDDRMCVLRIAVQKSGRLADGSEQLLSKCGIKVKSRSNQLVTYDDSFGIEFLFVRDDDIPGMIESGVCDIGIFGQNLLKEYTSKSEFQDSKLQTILPLGFSKCRLSLASPKEFAYSSPSDLNGKVIATSYPNTLKSFLKERNIEANVVTMHGSVELACHIGVADLICDLVSSGATLYENALKELVTISQSEAVLVRYKNPMNSYKSTLIDKLVLRIKGVQAASKSKYIMLHLDRDKIEQLARVLPGCETPTILDLNGISNKVAVHVVSQEDVFWETVEKLKEIGASSILVMPIDKMIS